MTQNPVVEHLVKGAIERCRERILWAKKGKDGDSMRPARAALYGGTPGITGGLKRSRGL